MAREDDTLGQLVAPLVIIDADGSDPSMVLDCQVDGPRISPDGRTIAFSVAMDDDSKQIATINVDGTDLRVLTAVDGYAETPDWSPDGSWLVFGLTARCDHPTCWDDGTSHEVIWRMDADGGDQHAIGDPDGWDREPRLSPDGRQVVFDRRTPDDPVGLVLTVRDLASGIERRVFSTDRDPEHLQWSPDGAWFLYNTPGYEPDQRVERMRTDDPTATPELLYRGSAYKPTYSPDGSAIVFGCDGRLCRMGADGSDPHTLLSVPGWELNHPDWGPNTP